MVGGRSLATLAGRGQTIADPGPKIPPISSEVGDGPPRIGTEVSKELARCSVARGRRSGWRPSATTNPRYHAMNDQPVTIVHPLSGERIVFRRRSRDTGGALLEADNFVAPQGGIKPHVHPNMEETFRIRTGPISFRIDGVESTHQVGETVVIPRGAVHEWWNPVETGEVAATMEFRPALDMETFFETYFGLAVDGRLKANGRPAFLQAMVLLHDFRREITLPGPDGALIKLLGPLLAPVGRRAGYRSRYERYSGQTGAKTPAPVVVNF
jgi:quercetin dioxygenase-like cupin family protein